MKIVIYLGTGGVGKTSVAAATALSLARSGTRTLVLTTDPSYRLRTALGLKDGLLEQQVPTGEGEAELWAALLDVKATLDEAVRLHAKPGNQERILQHPIYATIANSLSGMQELMAVERIDQLVRRGFANIVVDTAPSRHALDLLDKPIMFADLSASRRVKLVGRTYKFVQATGLLSIGRTALDIYKRAEEILGANLVRQVLDFYSLFFPIAEGYSERARKTVEMLRDPAVTEFRIVSTPTRALRDVTFFTEELATRKFRAAAVCVNRAWEHPLPAMRPEGLEGEIFDWYKAVRESHETAIDQLRFQLGGQVGRIQVISELERDVDGVEALRRIADQMQPATRNAQVYAW